MKVAAGVWEGWDVVGWREEPGAIRMRMVRGGRSDFAARLGSSGWRLFGPYDGAALFTRGPELGEAGRIAAETALRAIGVPVGEVAESKVCPWCLRAQPDHGPRCHRAVTDGAPATGWVPEMHKTADALPVLPGSGAEPLRFGQRVWALFESVAPDLVEPLRGGDLDPFHDDSRLPAFVAAVLARDAHAAVRARPAHRPEAGGCAEVDAGGLRCGGDRAGCGGWWGATRRKRAGT